MGPLLGQERGAGFSGIGASFLKLHGMAYTCFLISYGVCKDLSHCVGCKLLEAIHSFSDY